MFSMEQEFSEVEPYLRQLIQEEAEQEINLLNEPNDSIEPEEPTSLLPPATFGPNELPLTYDNIILHGTQLIEAHAQEHQLDIKANTISDFFSTILRANLTSEGLWTFLKICENPMTVGNTGFQRVFQFSEETSSINGPWSVGMRQLYVRCFALSISKLKDIIGYWETSKYFPMEIREWEEQCQNESNETVVYIRYVGQCLYPIRPWDRFSDDAATRNKMFFTHFAQALATEHPEVYKEAQVFALNPALPSTISGQEIDDYERLLICLLGHKQLLNRQLGGFMESYTPLEKHDEIFKKLHTDIYRRWSQRSSVLPENHYTIARLAEHIYNIQQLIHASDSILEQISDDYAQILVKEHTPSLYQNTVLITLIADDVTLEDFTLKRDYFSRFSAAPLSRSSYMTINSISHLLGKEQIGSADINSHLYLNMLPFKNMFPWIGKHLEREARDFTSKYLRIVQPLLILGMGFSCSQSLASNLLHSNGFHSKNFLPFAGIPKLCSFAGEEWLEDGEVLDPPEETLFLLLPQFDPGMYKHYANTRPLHTFNHLCWIVNILHISLAMNMLDENTISPVENRKVFLSTLMNRGAALMEEYELSSELTSARDDLNAMFRETAARQFPRKAFVKEIKGVRDSAAATLSVAEAEFAIGAPGSTERMQQLLRLWKKDLGRLHIIIPHRDDQKADWLNLMNEVEFGKPYAMSLMNKKQARDSVAAGKHPWRHILRPRKPAFVSDQGDDWMWIDEITEPILSEHGKWMQSCRKLAADHYSSEKQRDRAFSTTTMTFYNSIHNIPVLIRPDGRFYVYYQDPETNERHTFTMHHKAACPNEGTERRLVVTPTGLAVLNERGEPIPAAKRTGLDFMSHTELSNRSHGRVLKQAWERARSTAVVMDANVDAIEAGPSQTAMDIDETAEGYGSDTTVFSLAVRLYEGNVETASRNLVLSHRNPSSYAYTLPVHISDAVVPFKRFLDDCYQNGGRMFLSNPTLQLPPKYSQYVIWDSLLRHISQKSRRHPHYDYWRGIASGTSSLVPFAKHLAKLRPITFKGKRNVEVTDANGRPKRTKGTLLIFGSPLENAGKDVYRL